LLLDQQHTLFFVQQLAKEGDSNYNRTMASKKSVSQNDFWRRKITGNRNILTGNSPTLLIAHTFHQIAKIAGYPLYWFNMHKNIKTKIALSSSVMFEGIAMEMYLVQSPTYKRQRKLNQYVSQVYRVW